MKTFWFRIIALSLTILAASLFLARVPVSARPPGQPPIPHSIEGRETLCIACHSTGVADAPKYPSDHDGRTNEQCLLCHKLAGENATTPGANTPAAKPTVAATEEISGTLTATVVATGTVSAVGTVTVTVTGTVSTAETATAPATASATPTAEPTSSPSEKAPPIPHSLDGRDDCLACHGTGIAGAPKLPATHEGRALGTCRLCHEPGAVVEPTTAPNKPTAEAVSDIPKIPHPLEGRADCLACHGAGIGGAPKLTSSHAGRTSDTCLTCHQSAAPPEGEVPQILPTMIPHPTFAQNENTCAACHTNLGGKSAETVENWNNSIHSQRGVGCTDCHGGDSSAPDQAGAHATSANFVGTPNTVDIPALCAGCHARVDLMRQYDLPTDQWAKYQQSNHGKQLAQGDTNVATCFTCHDGHGTKQVTDPSAQVYPLNVPALCAGCHSNVELMKPYDIPTNQHELYIKSVHGTALLEKQDLRSPSCATCHGTHGAAPPGFEEVSNVCGSCHTATQDYYLKSVHASDTAGTPECVTCHGRYDVETPSDAMFHGEGARQCGSCHTSTSPENETVQAIAGSIEASAKAIDEAEQAIAEAAGSALIVAPEEAKLTAAKTNLITARAAQHTLDLDTVKEQTDAATKTANEVKADAQKAIDDSIFRREYMAIGLGIMALAILALWIVRRALYKELPKE